MVYFASAKYTTFIMEKNMRLLFAEDEPDLNKIVSAKLKDEGYSVDSCLDGDEALYYLQSADYDAAILDIMMPKKSGIEVLEAIRADGNNVPVLFLTARDSVRDKVQGLDAGADDYIIKPFSFDELMARIRVLTRSKEVQKGSIITVGDLEMDVAGHTLKRGGKNIELSAKEFSLLEYMMRNKDIVLKRERIEDHIWNFDYEGGTNVVDVHISHLRRKIDDGYDKKYIRTVRGVGYTLSSGEDA